MISEMRREEREREVHGLAREDGALELTPGTSGTPRRRESLAGAIDRARPSSDRRSRILLNLATLTVTVLFTYFALNGVDFGRAWHVLRTSDYVWLLPALVALGLSMVARAIRWRVLFAPDRRPPFGAVFVAMMIGYLFNNILPARAGEVARVVVLNRRTSAEPVEIVGTVVLERVFDLLGILVIFFVAEPWLPSVSWFGTAAIAAAVLAMAIATIALALAAFGERGPRLLLRPLRRLPFISDERLEQAARELTNGLSALRFPGVALLGFFWTIVAWLLTAVLAYLVTLAFHPRLPFAAGVLVTVAVGLAMILPSPPAALGVFEGAALVGLKAYGLSHTQALPYALILHLVNFLPFIVIGVALLQYNSRKSRATSPPTTPEEPPDSPPGATRRPAPAQSESARPVLNWNANGRLDGELRHELPTTQQPAAVQHQARDSS